MKWLLIILVLAFTLCGTVKAQTVYIIDYDSYRYNPCWDNTCLTIMCPLEGCYTEGKHIFCKDESCVLKILDEYGEEHLAGIWEINYKYKTSKKLIYKKSYKLERRLESEGETNGIIFFDIGTSILNVNYGRQ